MHALAGTVTNVAFQSSDGQFARALWRIVISRICLLWAENARPGECMLARTSARPFSGLPTYTANLCPLCGRAEFASLGEDFGEPIRKAVEGLSRRAIW